VGGKEIILPLTLTLYPIGGEGIGGIAFSPRSAGYLSSMGQRNKEGTQRLIYSWMPKGIEDLFVTRVVNLKRH